MNVLGIDPGLAVTGWAVLNEAGNKIKTIAYGCIKTQTKIPLPKRLFSIYQNLNQVIKKYRPQIVAIEEQYFPKRISSQGLPSYSRSILATTQARGVILLVVVQNELAVVEYNPKRVKIAITGYGNADKTQVQRMVKQLLGLQEIPSPDDIADAIALGLCHLHTREKQDDFTKN